MLTADGCSFTKSVSQYGTGLRVVPVHWEIRISSLQMFGLQHHVEASAWIMSRSVREKLSLLRTQLRLTQALEKKSHSGLLCQIWYRIKILGVFVFTSCFKLINTNTI